MSLPALQAPTNLSSQDRLLAMLQKQYPNYHPVLSMATLAHTTEDEMLEFACHKEIAKYVVQVDKHEKITAEVIKTKRVVVELFSNGENQSEVEAAEIVDAQIKTPVLEQTRGNSALDDQLVSQPRRGVALQEYSEVQDVAARREPEDRR